MSASGERQRAPGTVGCPRPRVQVTWTDERAAHGVTQTGNHWQSALATKEILQRKRRLCVKPPSASARPSASDAKADVGLCASPVPSSLSSNPPPSPFSSYLFSVYCWGEQTASSRTAKLPRPAGVLTGIKILPYERGQRTREGNFSQLRDKFSRSDSLKDKRVDGWGVIAGERQR